LLLHIHKNPAPENLLKYDINILIKESNLLTDWYLPNAIGTPLSETLIDEFQNILSKTFSKVPSNNPVLVMRDYHAENLIWLPKRSGINRVGLLDYQDALAGHPAYDLVSLLEDARRDTSSDLQTNMINKYISNSDLNREEFLMAYNLLGAQRNIKIIGIFSRLSLRDKKSNYINLIPRVWNHLMNNLNHEACSDLKQWVNKNVPCPNHIVLQKLVPVI
jgi:aminoglycoside/choline kinase family phosphotransferase